MIKKVSRSHHFSAETLEGLLGYHLRRATLTVLGDFSQHMSGFDLRPTELAVLSMIHDNPGIRAAQICELLEIQQPNLVKLLQRFAQQDWISRQEDPEDRRAVVLSLTRKGVRTLQAARQAAQDSESATSQRLTQAQRKQLIGLLKRLYD